IPRLDSKQIQEFIDNYEEMMTNAGFTDKEKVQYILRYIALELREEIQRTVPYKKQDWDGLVKVIKYMYPKDIKKFIIKFEYTWEHLPIRLSEAPKDKTYAYLKALPEEVQAKVRGIALIRKKVADYETVKVKAIEVAEGIREFRAYDMRRKIPTMIKPSPEKNLSSKPRPSNEQARENV
ncbi:hypothetical protein H4219_004565, partial [Mycoemilia scoparia]